MDECQLTIFASTLACTLAKCLTTEELTLLSATLVQLGDSLATILTKRELCEESSANSKL